MGKYAKYCVSVGINEIHLGRLKELMWASQPASQPTRTGGAGRSSLCSKVNCSALYCFVREEEHDPCVVLMMPYKV
ncbi:hypothetical protein O3P69_003752 [Scylla paramamosain]|uniref:Uncharacterized protein n=1 Tax=Scylla paramamosain TaxID=85552 RepID=A0AAW0UE03_SCYPA